MKSKKSSKVSAWLRRERAKTDEAVIKSRQELREFYRKASPSDQGYMRLLAAIVERTFKKSFEPSQEEKGQ